MSFVATAKKPKFVSGLMKLDAQVRAFLDIHFNKWEYLHGKKSMGQQMIFCKNGAMKPIRMATGEEFVNQVMALEYSTYADYYLTANSFKRNNPRDMSNIFGLHNIVIDCDMHGEDHTPSYFMQICKYFREDLRDYLRACAPDIPLPNTIVYSGRGLQFWWSFLPILKEYEDCYDFLLDVFINTFKKFLQDNPQYSQFEVDEGASRNKAGLFRMPGTYNTHSDTKTSVYIIHDEVSDMFAMRKELTPKHHMTKVRTSFFGPGSVDFSENGFKKYASFRANAILQLLSLRKFDVNGSRDFFLWLYHNECWKFMSEQEAYDAMVKMNDMFTHPIKASRLSHIVSGTIKRSNDYQEDHGGYALKNTTIINILNITEEEQKIIGLYPTSDKKCTGTPNKTRDAKNREKKRLKRLREVSLIKHLIRGLSQVKAAKLFQVCYNTVRRIVKDWKAGKYRDIFSVEDEKRVRDGESWTNKDVKMEKKENLAAREEPQAANSESFPLTSKPEQEKPFQYDKDFEARCNRMRQARKRQSKQDYRTRALDAIHRYKAEKRAQALQNASLAQLGDEHTPEIAKRKTKVKLSNNREEVPSGNQWQRLYAYEPSKPSAEERAEMLLQEEDRIARLISIDADDFDDE